MPTLKSELSKSIARLKAYQSFDIIFYQDAKVERFQPGFVGVGADNKRKASAYLDGITAKGENNPTLAMTAALKLKPGLVYFLTDAADFKDPAALQAVIKKYNADKDANGKPKIKINTILFIKDKAEHEKNADSEELMHQIAGENGGNFRWVELEALP